MACVIVSLLLGILTPRLHHSFPQPLHLSHSGEKLTISNGRMPFLPSSFFMSGCGGCPTW